MQTKIHEPTQIVEVMLTHAEQADEFTELLTRERRIQDNLALLQWAFVGMVEMIKARMESSSSDEHALNEKFWEAVHRSVRKQVTEFRMIQSKFKEGNIGRHQTGRHQADRACPVYPQSERLSELLQPKDYRLYEGYRLSDHK